MGLPDTLYKSHGPLAAAGFIDAQEGKVHSFHILFWLLESLLVEALQMRGRKR
jgi:hypothetical protein